MQKWEYLTVHTAMDNNEYKARLLNGREIPDWKKGPPLSDYLNILGEQGWELIDTTPYTFKRLKT